MMLKSTKYFFDKYSGTKPKIAIILGSGLTNFFEDNEKKLEISYSDLTDFPKPTVEGHAGKLVLGDINNKSVVCMYGRSHIYEGHQPQSLTVPIRMLKEIGCETLIVTNAAGSLNENMPAGSLMIIKDHINWSGFNPLIGKNDENFGPRFFDMSNAYDSSLRENIMKIGQKENINLYEGVYIMYSGPNFETPAEIKAFKTLGADAVGMSTVPEIITATHCGLKNIGLSIVTNFASGLSLNALTHNETLAEAKKAEEKVIKLIKKFINNY